jgi:hypothetical protein
MDPTTETVTPSATDGETPVVRICNRCKTQEETTTCPFGHAQLLLFLSGAVDESGNPVKPPRYMKRCNSCLTKSQIKPDCGYAHGHLFAKMGGAAVAVASAVVEEKTNPVVPVKKACRDFASSGSCPRGDTCKFLHAVESAEVDVTPILEVKPEKKGGKGNNKPAVPIAAGGSKASLEAGGVKAPSEKDDLAALVAKVLAEKVSEFVKVIKISGITNDIDVSKLSEEDLKMMINLSFSSSIPKPKGKGKKEGK